MQDVFPALERRFNASTRLVSLARKLYQGHSGQVVKRVRAHVEVTCTNIDHDFDTFSTYEPVYTLEFNINTRDKQPDTAGKIMRELFRMYHEVERGGGLDSPAFTTSSMRVTAQNGPYLEDGTYRADMTFDLHVCLQSAEPAERQAV